MGTVFIQDRQILVPPFENVSFVADDGVTLEHTGGRYRKGSIVTNQASVDFEHDWAGWHEKGVCICEEENISHRVKGDHSILAKSQPKPYYDIVFTPGENGKVSNVGGSYMRDTTAECEAQPNGGFYCTGWYNGDDKIQDNSKLSVVVDGPAEYNCRFERIPYTINIIAGTLTTNPDGTYTATAISPGAGYVFQGWDWNNSRVSNANPYTFTPTANGTIRGSYISQQWSGSGKRYFDIDFSPYFIGGVMPRTIRVLESYMWWNESYHVTTTNDYPFYDGCSIVRGNAFKISRISGNTFRVEAGSTGSYILEMNFRAQFIF